MSGWYADGLQFGCTQCGNCCTGTPGYVWVSPKERTDIAALLGISVDEFLERYTRIVNGRVSLLERPGGDCVLLTDDRSCAIQSKKPRQCLMFPFWPRLLSTRKEWEKAGERCPGINTGPRYSPDEVEVIANGTSPRDLLQRIFAKKREP